MNILYLLGCPRPGREAKENIIFFASKSPTKLRSWMAESPQGLPLLATYPALEDPYVYSCKAYWLSQENLIVMFA